MTQVLLDNEPYSIEIYADARHVPNGLVKFRGAYAGQVGYFQGDPTGRTRPQAVIVEPGTAVLVHTRTSAVRTMPAAQAKSLKVIPEEREAIAKPPEQPPVPSTPPKPAPEEPKRYTDEQRAELLDVIDMRSTVALDTLTDAQRTELDAFLASLEATSSPAGGKPLDTPGFVVEA